MSRRVRVHHFIANLTTRQYGSHPTSDLLGVDYWHEVPADTEFPRWVAKLDLFTRFYLNAPPPHEFFIRVWWLDGPRRPKGIRTGEHGPFRIAFQPGTRVLDSVFRLTNVRLLGVGRYAVRLVRYRQSEWKTGKAAVYAETHFQVER